MARPRQMTSSDLGDLARPSGTTRGVSRRVSTRLASFLHGGRSPISGAVASSPISMRLASFLPDYPTRWQNFSDTLLTMRICWMKMVGFHCVMLSPDSIAQQPRWQRQCSYPTDMMMNGDVAHDLRCTNQARARGFEPLTGRITDSEAQRSSTVRRWLSEAPLLADGSAKV